MSRVCFVYIYIEICVYIETKQNIVNHHTYYIMFNFITIPDNRIRYKLWKYSQHFINKSPLYR